MTRTGTKSTPVRMRATAARGRRSGPKIQEAGGSNLYKTESYRLWPNCVPEPDVVGSESKFSQAQGATARAEDVELCPKLKRLNNRAGYTNTRKRPSDRSRTSGLKTREALVGDRRWNFALAKKNLKTSAEKK